MTKRKNRHIGSTFESWLDEQGIRDEVTVGALQDATHLAIQDNIAWAKPFVEEAHAAIAKGDVLTIEEHKARNLARLASLRK